VHFIILSYLAALFDSNQAVHGRVTSEVSIAKLQMAAIFLSIQKFGWWITPCCCI